VALDLDLQLFASIRVDDTSASAAIAIILFTMYCWASCLGDCAGGQSGEHVVSECLWEGDAVSVLGGRWAPSVPKTIGLQAIKANILCATHNSRLSDADSEGGRAFDALRQFVFDQQAVRRGLKEAGTEPIERIIDRTLLERWFLKTTINLVTANKSDAKWRITGSSAREPPDDFVRAAFGLSRLAVPMGLYVAPRKGETFLSDDRVVFTEILDERGQIAGADFRFRGLEFAVWLSREMLPATVAMFRSAKFNWESGGRITHSIEIADRSQPDVPERVTSAEPTP